MFVMLLCELYVVITSFLDCQAGVGGEGVILVLHIPHKPVIQEGKFAPKSIGCFIVLAHRTNHRNQSTSVFHFVPGQ